MADKIKRAFVWLRKALVITEKTTAPGALLNTIQTTLDVFGWERYDETTNRNTVSAANVNTVSSPAVPDDVLRLIIEASVETSNAALAFHMWMDKLDAASNINVGVMRPIAVPISAIVIRNALERPLILRPGDVLAGRCTPATGVGETLAIRQRFIDLPIGEYIRSL